MRRPTSAATRARGAESEQRRAAARGVRRGQEHARQQPSEAPSRPTAGVAVRQRLRRQAPARRRGDEDERGGPERGQMNRQQPAEQGQARRSHGWSEKCRRSIDDDDCTIDVEQSLDCHEQERDKSAGAELNDQQGGQAIGGRPPVFPRIAPADRATPAAHSAASAAAVAPPSIRFPGMDNGVPPTRPKDAQSATAPPTSSAEARSVSVTNLRGFPGSRPAIEKWTDQEEKSDPRLRPALERAPWRARRPVRVAPRQAGRQLPPRRPHRVLGAGTRHRRRYRPLLRTACEARRARWGSTG